MRNGLTMMEMDKMLADAVRARARADRRGIRATLEIIVEEWLVEHGDIRLPFPPPVQEGVRG